jgi:hypothetical protein
MCIVEPFPIAARWRRCEDIREYAMTLPPGERKKYLRKVVKDYIAFLVQVGVAPDKIEREQRDMERLVTMPPDNGGTLLRKAA